MRSRFVLAVGAGLGAVAAPAAAQSGPAEPPVITVPPPPRIEAPPDPSATAPSGPAAPVTVAPPPPETITVVPPEPALPPEPITIDPDAAYPEGFADPPDPFANDISPVHREQPGGFDWGLLGLLGLLGLIPLFRRRERSGSAVHAEEPDPGT